MQNFGPDMNYEPHDGEGLEDIIDKFVTRHEVVSPDRINDLTNTTVFKKFIRL